MKHLPKSTLTEILNDPYGFTYKEMSEVIGEDKARALYTELYKQPFHKENLSISTKKVYKSSDTEKYVYELKDNLGVVHSLEIVQEYGFALFFRQSTDCFKKQLRRDFLPGSFKGDFPFEIFIKGMKLPRFF
jgi:hypothetical protein